MSDSRFPLTAALGHDLVVLDDVESTNRYLVEHLGEPNRVKIVVTTNQTAGRGRLDRAWLSPPGSGLALSVALPASLTPSPLTPAYLQLVSLVTGGCVAEAVTNEVSDEVMVKWPNDVLVGEKKVAGILGEIGPGSRIIVGVGLNIELAATQLPTVHATSLHLHGAHPPGLADRFVATFVPRLLNQVADVVDGLTVATQGWLEGWLTTLGRPVSVDYPTGERLVGVAEGLGQDGSLQVRDQSGRLVAVTAGDVYHLRHRPASN